MKICDLETGLGKLAQATSHLKERWQATQEHWRDDAARQFEKTHLGPLPARLQLLVAAAQRLSEVLREAERECSDRGDES
ncbi:MAG: hypothetical protein SFU86_08530 [Pirellulaceae bacterium]|nr:hypothetical protein [Pirellulaceae bacterium]